MKYLLLHFNWNFPNSIVYGRTEWAHRSTRRHRTFHRRIDTQWLRWWTHRVPVTIARFRILRIWTQWHFDDGTGRSLMCEFRLKWCPEHALIHWPSRFFLRHFWFVRRRLPNTTSPARYQRFISSISIISISVYLFFSFLRNLNTQLDVRVGLNSAHLNEICTKMWKYWK